MILETQAVTKSFGDPPTQVLTDISVQIQTGEFVSLTGRSGSGKSTLLYLLSTLDKPTTGVVHLEGRDVVSMGSKELHHYRNAHIGFVFQFHYLLPELTALENVLMPAIKAGKAREYDGRARELLQLFELGKKTGRFPSQLSGGEQQRVAIARALIMKPKIIFADEPTGNLDTANGELVMDIFKKANQTEGTTIIMVTHDPGFASRAQRQIHLVDGKVTAK